MERQEIDFYANSVHVLTGDYEITLRFRNRSVIAIKEEEPLLGEIGVCSIRMSPQHAKAVAALLTNNVVEYEKRFNVVLPVETGIQVIWEKYTGGN